MPLPCLISIPLACFPWSCFLIHNRLAFSARNKIAMWFFFPPSLYWEAGRVAKKGRASLSFQPSWKEQPFHTDGAMGKLHTLFLLPSRAHAEKPWWSFGWPQTLPKSWWPPALNEASCFVCCPLNKSPLQQLLYFSLQTKRANLGAFRSLSSQALPKCLIAGCSLRLLA